MNHLISDASVLIQSLGWTLLHSLWQGAVIAAGLWLVLKMIPDAGSGARYHLSLAALSLLTVWVAGTWMQQWQLMQAIQVHVTESSAYTLPARTYVITTLPQSADSWQWLRPFLPQLEQAFPWIVGSYAAGLLLMTLRLTAGFVALFRIRHTGITTPDARWLQLLETLKDRLDMDGRVQLFLSARVSLPVVLGFIKPVILVPAATIAQLSPEQLEAILLHELAHIRRNDYLINLLQTIVETILFFNPFVWQISGIIRREREHCCDDLVLDNAPEPLPYATALATLERTRFGLPAGALAAAGQPRHLLNRIQRIMEMKKSPSNYSRMAAAFLVISAIACSVIWLTPSFGQGKKKQKEETPPVREHAGSRPPVPPVPPRAPQPPAAPAPPEEIEAVTEQALSIADSSLQVADEVLRNMDLADIEKTVEAALKGVDWNRITIAQQDAMRSVNKAMKTVQVRIPDAEWKKLTPEQQREVKEALGAAREALNNVDMEQIRQEVTASMAAVDWTKINIEVRQGLADARRELNDPQTRIKIKREITEARREAAEARRDAAAARRESLEEARIRREEVRARGEEQREEARARSEEQRTEAHARRGEAVARAGKIKASTNNYRRMLDLMDDDGLIDRDSHFTIEQRKGRLYINGREQNDAVHQKYQSYLGAGKVTISGNKNSLSIHRDQ